MTGGSLNDLIHKKPQVLLSQGTVLEFTAQVRTATLCNTLQHAATRCNTLQHAATRCNTLQHLGRSKCLHSQATASFLQSSHSSFIFGASSHCNTLQHTATHCNTLQQTATHCNMRGSLDDLIYKQISISPPANHSFSIFSKGTAPSRKDATRNGPSECKSEF